MRHSLSYLSAAGIWICRECDWRTDANHINRAKAEILFRADPRHRSEPAA